MSKTIFVFPNPYSQLDAKGRLAGVCQMAEPGRGNGPPLNIKVGAKLVLVDGTYNDRQAELATAIETGKLKGPIVPTLLFPRGEVFVQFTVSDPVAVQVGAEDEAFYINRCKSSNGTAPCLLACKSADDVPFEVLAEQRLDAIERYRAAFAKKDAPGPDVDPPFDAWKAQFPLDEDVAELMKVVADKRKAAREDVAKAAKAASDKAVADAKKAQDDKAEKRKKLLDAAKKEMLGAGAEAVVSGKKPLVAASEK